MHRAVLALMDQFRRCTVLTLWNAREIAAALVLVGIGNTIPIAQEHEGMSVLVETHLDRSLVGEQRVNSW